MHPKRVIRLMVLATVIGLISCVASERGLGRYRQSQEIKKETFVESQKKPQAVIEITQRPTPEMPILKFKADVKNNDYVIREYDKLESVEQTITYKPLVTTGWISAIAGLGYFLANPSPDPAKYEEDKYDELNKEKLASRQIGLGLMASGVVSYFVGKSKPDRIRVVEKPVGVIEEKIIQNPETRAATFIAQIKGYSSFLISDSMDEDCYGNIKIDEMISSAIGSEAKLPESITLEIKLDTGETKTVYWTITEAVALMTRGKTDWTKVTPKLTPFLTATIEMPEIAQAGESIAIKVNISNKEGKGDASRLVARIKSSEDIFNRSILIGQVKAGEEHTFTESFNLPKEWITRRILIQITFQESSNNVPKPIEKILLVKEVPQVAETKPFSYSFPCIILVVIVILVILSLFLILRKRKS
jgi:hypothetical protein